MPWPWEIQGRTASGLLAGVLAQFEVGDGIEVQTATEAPVSCQIGQDVDVWNLETPNGSMFV